MMTQENVRLVEQVAALQTSHEIEKLLALFTDDVVYEDVPFGIVAKGRAEMKELFEATWESLHSFAMTLQSVVADADRGGMEWVLSGTHLGDFGEYPASGRSVSVRAAAIMRFSNGRISHWNDYWSLSTFKEQIGSA